MAPKQDTYDPYKFTTRDYQVMYCPSGQYGWAGKPCYQAINTHTHVVEFESGQLPNCVLNLLVLQKAMDDIRSGVAFQEVDQSFTVTKFEVPPSAIN